ncbi:hypothetical protein CBGD1_1110 [Sulfurimonas gotlandica GD1]|nr:hypothetical protein CBGD1_1110 [Sulfurimonas gotlandica GD1]
MSLIIILFFLHLNLQAQEKDSSWSSVQLGMIFKFEHQQEEAIEGIKKAQATMIKAQNLISVSKKKNKPDVEAIAYRAFTTAQNNKQRYERIKMQIQKNISYIKNKDGFKMKLDNKITGIITNYTGRVEFTSDKPPYDVTYINDESAKYIREGDVISTYANSSVEIECLDGRGSVKIGEYSSLKIKKKDDTAEILSLIKGNLDVAVEKAEKFALIIDENVKKLLNHPMDFTNKEINMLKAKMQRKFEVRTPTAVLAVRGTKFRTNIDKAGRTILDMKEGVVDVTNLKDLSHTLVYAGERLIINIDGSTTKE